MKPYVLFLIPVLFLVGCKSVDSPRSAAIDRPQTDFAIAFGSCNKSGLPNVLWDDVLGLRPNVWIWGGDNIYADTEDMDKMEKLYDKQDQVAGYALLKKSVPIIGTWDDHDYGVNDGGVEFSAKQASQQVFLDFMDVPVNDSRREREGVYASHDYMTGGGSIKVLVLDTRYFRTPLSPDQATKKRFKPNDSGEGTIFG
ncbi:MAG: alkaline phosphatase D family protein [Flavobacteriaceae bacterium]